MTPAPEVAAIILAAGKASRYRAGGGAEETKLVAKLDGEPLVRRVARAALGSRARPVVAVLGHAQAAVRGALADLPVETVFNADYASGLASSLRAGVAALPATAAGAVVLLGDMPMADPGLIDALIEAFAANPGVLAAVPVREGRRGNPVLLSRELFGKALRLSGDEGARRLIQDLGPTQRFDVVSDAWDTSFDIDLPCDLEAAGRHILGKCHPGRD
jgi:molybdenum cofactor cytidylyltransferase